MADPLGPTFLRWARRWLDEASVAHIVEPMVADARHERATHTGSPRLLVTLRWRAAFLATFALGAGRGFARPASWAPLRSLAFPILLFVGIEALLELLTSWIGYPASTRAAPLLLVPGIVTSALPLAVLPTVMRLMSDHRWRPWQARTAAVLIGACAMAITVPMNGWVAPAANQQFRIHAAQALGYPQPPARGAHELMLSELFAERPPAPSIVSPRQLQEERHLRSSVLLAPVSLAVLGAALARLGLARRVWHTVAAWALVAQSWTVWISLGVWMAAMIAPPLSASDPYCAIPDVGRFAAWTPHVMLLGTAVLCHRVASAREVATS